MIADSFMDEIEKIAVNRSTLRKLLGYGGAAAALGLGGAAGHHFGLFDGAMGAAGGHGGGHAMGDLIGPQGAGGEPDVRHLLHKELGVGMGDIIGPQGAEGKPDVRGALHKALGIDGSGFKGLGGSGSATRDALDSMIKDPGTGHVNNVLGRGTGHLDGLAADSPNHYAGGKGIYGNKWPDPASISGGGLAGDMGGGGSTRALSALSKLLRR